MHVQPTASCTGIQDLSLQCHGPTLATCFASHFFTECKLQSLHAVGCCPPVSPSLAASSPPGIPAILQASIAFTMMQEQPVFTGFCSWLCYYMKWLTHGVQNIKSDLRECLAATSVGSTSWGEAGAQHGWAPSPSHESSSAAASPVE